MICFIFSLNPSDYHVIHMRYDPSLSLALIFVRYGLSVASLKILDDSFEDREFVP